MNLATSPVLSVESARSVRVESAHAALAESTYAAPAGSVSGVRAEPGALPEGLACLAAFLDKPGVTDVVVTGDGAVLLKQFGSWNSDRSPFETKNVFLEWLIELFEQSGVELNYLRPMASTVVGRFRLHGILAHGVVNQPQVVIRRLAPPISAVPFSADGVSTQRVGRLADAMQRGQSVLIAGGPGAGKTTLLRLLLQRLRGLRIITIEDVPELQLDEPNVVSLVTRDQNQDGFGEVGLSQLLIEALRMSPDRIAVGEVRGVELAVMLEALNTGQAGGGATIHANSLQSVPARLEAIGLRAGIHPGLLARQVVSAFALVAFVRQAGGVFEIAEIGRPVLTERGLEVVRVD